jgi:hypothetical protein
MKRLASGSIGIAQGTRMMFADFVDGGVMWTGSGDRETRHIISFDGPYLTPPCVHVSMTLWDTDHQTNARGALTAEFITETGFQLVFKTWGDSRIARLKADWMAIGILRDDDAWDVD